MVEARVRLENSLGLHARAAAKLVQVAGQYPCRVLVEYQGQEVDGKSILGLLLLAAPCGDELVLRCDGEAEGEALTDLRALVESRFGEAS